MSLKDDIVAYLDSATMMQVATAIEGAPWCATVYFAHDNAHNLYWLSLPTTRHSQDIAQNNRVAGTIVAPQNAGQPPRGLQFEGTAREITDPQELMRLVEAYEERYARNNLAEAIMTAVNPNRFYQITPSSFMLFDQQTSSDQPKQVWKLTDTEA